MTKRIRFWHYHNSEAVKIKITAGETIRHSSGGPTEMWTMSEGRLVGLLPVKGTVQ